MKKIQILIAIFLILISISAYTTTQVKATISNVVVLPSGPIKMDVGQVQVFTASFKGGSGTISYQWYLGSSSVASGSPDYSFSPTSSGSYIISVEVDDSDFPIRSPDVSVVVSPALVAPTVSSTPGMVNQGQTSSLTSTVVSTGSSPYSYQWLSRAPGAGSYSLISGATSSIYSFATSGSTTTGVWSFELQVTDAASAVVTSNAVSVTVNAVPTVVLSPTSWVMDVGQSKLFSATASGGSGSFPSTGYHWYVGGVVQSGETASTFSYSPSSAGSFSITVSVTDSLGSTSGQSSAASVVVAVLPIVSIVPVGPVKMDVGQVQVFTASGSGGSGSLSYQWYLDGVVVGGNSASYSYTAAGSSHSVTCRVTDSASVPVASVASNAVSVVVSPALVAPTVSSTPGMVNQGQTSSLTSTVVSTGSSPYSYQWLSRAPGAGSYSLISGATSSIYSFATSGSTTTGVWSFELQVTDAASAVVTSNAVSVTVNAVPTVVLSPTSWVMDVGQSKLFSATASGGSGSFPSTGYHWYVGGVVQSGETASTFSYSPSSAGSFSITVSVTDSLGSTSGQSSAASVVVAVLPIVSIVPVGPVKMDVGQVQVFTASGSGGSGSLSYQWYLDGVVVGGNSASYSYTAAGSSHSVTCRVTDSASVPVASVASNAVSVVVSPALVAPTVSSTPGMVNQGQTSSLTSTVVSTGSSPYSYQWLSRAPGAGSYSLISGATSSIYSFATSGSTTTGVWSFELQVTDAASAVVTSNAVSVTVNAVPTVVLSPTSWVMDVGQSKLFSATASGGSGSFPSTGYHWYVGGVVQSGETASTFSYSPSSAGSFSITVSVTDSLGSTSGQSSAASVVVAVLPIVSIVPVGPVKMDVGQVQVFTASGSGGSGSLSYQWYLDGVVVGGNSASYSYTAAGSSHSVTCRVTDSASVPVASVASNAVSVVVSPALVAPTVSSTPGMVNQGQTSSLTSTVVSTGSSPYSYQWLSRAPGAGSYSLISGATSSSYSFVTSIATATGNWSFILQVKDSVAVAVNSSATSVTVNIPPLDHFIFSSVGTQTAGTSFNITITAKDASNNTLTNFVGTNSLNVSTGTTSPSSTGVFSKGVWTGSVTLTSASSAVTLFTTGSGMSGTSNSFIVNSGALNRFTFSPISSPQTSGSDFSITITAKDAYDNIVTSYNGSPTLTVSAGSISHSTMNAFVNGMGATTVTVIGENPGITITATDSVYSGISNSFAIAISPTPTSNPSPSPTPTLTTEPTQPPSATSEPIQTSTPTSTPRVTPNPTSKPTPSSTPEETTVKAKTDNGATVNFAVSGNITSSQISNVAITTNSSANSTTISMTVTGEGGTTGFSNITIPKTAILFGTNPVVLIDGQQAPNQGYTQDSENYYVWCTAHFSTHQMKIQFTSLLRTQTSSFEPLLAVAIITPEIVLVYTVIAVRRLRRRPENT